MDYKKFKPGDIVYYMSEDIDYMYNEITRPSSLKKVVSIKKANKLYKEDYPEGGNSFANLIIKENKKSKPVFIVELDYPKDIGWMAEKDLIKATKAHILLFREKNDKT